MDILNGFVYLFSNPTAVAFVFLAALVGVIVGAIPGLTAAAAIAMLVPVTFYLDPLTALAFLYVIGKSGRFGGSISAILFNTPGTAASAATLIDGYPMTRRGQAGKALKTASIASVFGDTVGELILIFGAVAIASVTQQFGPPEYFAVYMMAFIIISSVTGDSIIKGLLSTVLGILVALIGIDPISAEPRLDFGLLEFQSGLALIPLLLGIFVLSELAIQVEIVARGGVLKEREISDDPDASRFTLPEFRRCIPVMLRSSLIGAFIGILPGLGSAVAGFAAYGEEKRRAKEPEKWGTGIVEGVAAPESANNAVSGPTMIPLLALGVPGSTIAAILIGVFLIHGIPIGPSIFDTSRDLIFGLFAAGLVGIVLYGIIGYYGGPLIGHVIALVPPRLIYPYIFLTCIVSAYSARTSVFDVFIMSAAGLFGYLMRKVDFSPAAFIIAFVLASGAEEAFRQSLLLSSSGWLVFFERPWALVFFAFAVLVSGQRIWKKMRPSHDPKPVRPFDDLSE
uniref:tripartite tricarboxylate transporter permease n=1 Tax=Pararhizobium sp. IMCC3301 TaxID=3067904 RepID=UPI00274078BB|nr:tripartite tricarboxylate transporter permease [Pararhizobium sp. IMCC3301]